MDRRHLVVLGGILVVALALRVGMVVATPDYRPVTDDLDYDRNAVALVDFRSYAPPLAVTGGGEASAFRPPLYPFSLAAVYAVSGTGDTGVRWDAGRVAQAGLGTLAVALTVLVAWLLAGPGAGLVAGALAAVFPPLLMISSSLLTENLFICCELGALAAVLWFRRTGSTRWLVLAGVGVGLAGLTRGNGLILVVPLLLGAWTGRPRFSRSALAAPAVLVVAAALTVAPWTVRNAVALDAFVPVSTQSGFALAGQFNVTTQEAGGPPRLWRSPYLLPEFQALFVAMPPLGELEVRRRLRRSARDYIRDHPGALADSAWWNGRRLLALDGLDVERGYAAAIGLPQWVSDLAIYGFLVLAPLAVLGALTAGARRVPPWVWLMPALLLLSILFVSGAQRYRTTADPFVILLAALALCSVAERLGARRA